MHHQTRHAYGFALTNYKVATVVLQSALPLTVIQDRLLPSPSRISNEKSTAGKPSGADQDAYFISMKE